MSTGPEQLRLFDDPSARPGPAGPAPGPVRLGRMEVHVGTSGYSFPDWRGRFYPRGLKPRAELGYYATRFPAVELNFTHYRPPTAAALAAMRERTPPGFRFVVKLHRFLTHEWEAAAPEELAARAREFAAALSPLREAGRLAAVLAQFPGRFQDGPAARAHLARLRELLPADPLVVEFRHRSWSGAAVGEFLARAGLIPCAVDEPELPELLPRQAPQTRAGGGLFYLRLHSRDAAKWYAGGAARYDYNYSDAELAEWVARLGALAESVPAGWVFFNNCARAQAAENAARFISLLQAAGEKR